VTGMTQSSSMQKESEPECLPTVEHSACPQSYSESFNAQRCILRRKSVLRKRVSTKFAEVVLYLEFLPLATGQNTFPNFSKVALDFASADATPPLVAAFAPQLSSPLVAAFAPLVAAFAPQLYFLRQSLEQLRN
jgi:hypothetical protein